MTNTVLLLTEAVLYFGMMVSLFRLRKRIGIGVFLCALGVMHFLETYLASSFYVATPVGMLSPGSTVLFSGKLVMLLLLYLKEDAVAVRQPIYGLLLGNALTVALVLILRFHEISALPGAPGPDMSFIDEMGWLMVWGTSLLYLDAILIILLYEKLGGLLRGQQFLRTLVSVACILTLDQVGFWFALNLVAGAPVEALVGGWAGKMAAALLYSGLLALYLRHCERDRPETALGIGDIFQALTFRERYEALVEHSGRDALTGLLHRGRFDELGERMVVDSRRNSTPLTLLIVDVDHFKAVNDKFGHAEGDRVLKAIAALLAKTAGRGQKVFRIGGEEFAILCAYPHPVGKLLGETIRQALKLHWDEAPTACTVSIGVATLGESTRHLADLFAMADRRLYAAKASGRDRVVGETSGPAAASQAVA